VKKHVAVIAVMLLAMTACGSSADEETAKKNISTAVSKPNSSTGTSPIGKKEADCFSNKVVDKLGVDKLKKYGILDEKLQAKGVNGTKMTESDATDTADAFASCVDVEKVFSSLYPQAGEGSAVVDCIKKALNKDAIRAMLKAGFMGEEAESVKALEPAQKCATQALPSDLPTVKPSP
jgi:hypothetical protein